MQAATIKESLDSYDDLIVDLVEFTTTTVRVLQEMPRDLVEVKVPHIIYPYMYHVPVDDNCNICTHDISTV